MDCRIFDEVLLEFLYKELAPERQHEVEDHLRTCPKCAEKLASFQAVRDGLQETADLEPGPFIAQRIIATARETASSRARPWWSFLLRPSAATVFTALIAIGIGIIYYNYNFTHLKVSSVTDSVQPQGAAEDARPVGPGTETLVKDASRPPLPHKGRSTEQTFKPLKKKEEVLIARSRPAGPAETPSAGAELKETDMPVPRKLLLLEAKTTLREEEDESVSALLQSPDAKESFERGNQFFKQGDYDRAVVNYLRVIENNPRGQYSPYSRHQLALSYGKKGKPRDAVRQLELLHRDFQDYPKRGEALVLAGDMCFEYKDYKRSHRYYQLFAKEFPRRVPLVSEKLKRVEELLSLYEE